jgi:hypothetical protein
MIRHLIRLAAVLPLAFLAAAHAATLKSTTLGQGSASYGLSYYSNKTLAASMPDIKRVIIIMHGAGRDGDFEFTATNAQLHNSGANIPEILLIEPQLYNDEDANAGAVPGGNPYWSGTGWIYGYDSVDGRALSSFALMDQLVKKLTDAAAFPNLTELVLAGHSAGGQFFSRYAALTNVHASVPSRVRVKYVIANPGSHLWFDSTRPQGSPKDGATAFETFTDTSECPNFNTYKYGLDNMSASQPFHYPVTMTANDLFKRFASRLMYYYQGTADTVPYWSTTNNPPDGNCGAVLGGDYRFARGVTNARYQRLLAGKKGVSLNRLFRQVNGVGHDTGRMYGSVCASNALFGSAQMLNTQGATCSDLN